MLDFALIAIQLSLVYGVSGIAVRLALAVQGGVDLFPAFVALVGSELFVEVCNRFVVSGIWPSLSAIVSFGFCIFLGIGWAIFSRSFFTPFFEGKNTLLVSLGLLLATSGCVGLWRGPGLVVFDAFAGKTLGFVDFSVGAGMVMAIGVSLSALLIISIYLRLRPGYALKLFLMNPDFAIELGVEQSRMQGAGLVLASLLGASAGMSLALVSGSYPDLGIKIFLYGAGAALLFESKVLLAPLLGGATLGVFHVCLQLAVSPSWAEGIMFAAVIFVILAKGTDRDWGGNR